MVYSYFSLLLNNCIVNSGRYRETRNGKSIKKQNGGYKVLNQDGQYYVYGLPAYNNIEVENLFSIDGDGSVEHRKNLGPTTGTGNNEEVDYEVGGTDEFIDKKTKPPYAHSYMLTSILGADYVDVNDNGPSDEDLGYWVKLNYVKYTDDYKWRAPYFGCNYERGSNASVNDDKGTYTYGEKELWYVASMETKTHIMTFEMSERKDNLEAAGEFSANETLAKSGSKTGLKIDRMLLFTKENYNSDNPKAIQIVNFEYDYSLCPGVTNNKLEDYTDLAGTVHTNEGGKLTLKKVWFEYEGSTRGATNPYVFDYDQSVNYPYDPFQYDRWGNHKKDFLLTEDNNFANRFLPYVKQFNNDGTSIQEEKNANTSAWSLSKIELPSGGEINVSYEADDYAYVQDEVATQMFNITKVNDNTSDDLLYQSGGTATEFNDPRARRIYFQLETPLQGGQTNLFYATEIYNNYVKDIVDDGDGKKNLYFKTYTNLRDNIYDYVAGYIPIIEWDSDLVNFEGVPYSRFGVDDLTNSNGEYTHGFITIERQKKSNEAHWYTSEYYKNYHPFAMAAWQHMRVTDPLLLTAPAGIDLSSSANGDDEGKANTVSSLLGFVPSTIQMFTGIWKYCNNNNFGRRIDRGKSVIRLTTPDKRKYGGGHRIKQIAISDNWDDFSSENESTYGVEYEYTTIDKNSGELISSGVAQYEPLQGGDEIALRKPKHYINNIPFKANNSGFFEHPLNEFYYPSATVGYSKVKVKSIHTGLRIKNQENSITQDSDIGTTGITEYEFYTAKDFPVITEEKNIEMAKRNLTIPIPFLGGIKLKKIKATQAYKIELNDMHGQAKSVKKYGLNSDYIVNEELTSMVEYKYNQTEIRRGSGKYRLNNVVEVLRPSNDGVPIIENKLIGIEYDFFTDQRQNKSTISTIGVESNIDIIVIPTPTPISITVPAFFPKVNYFKQDLKQFVSNKIIFKSGILMETITYDGKSSVSTKNEAFDGQTGRPLITSVNNEYDDKLFNYSHPAHWEYEQMGGAYKNIDLKFKAKILEQGGLDVNNEGLFKFESNNQVIDKLVSGDELIARWITLDIGNSNVCNTGDAFVDSVVNVFIGDLKNGFSDLVSYIGVDSYITELLGEYTTHYGGVKATYLGKENSSTGILHSKDIDLLSNLSGTDQVIDFRIIRSGRRNHVFADAGSIISKQMPVERASTTSPFSTIITSENIQVGSSSVNSSIDDLKRLSLNNVINASAVLYKDKWSAVVYGVNPYALGEAGIWRPYKSYIYASTRNSTNLIDEDNHNLKNAGEMDGVELFNWQISDYENYSPNWEWSSEISRYNSEAYEIENEDRLGIKSSALYGLKGSLVLGVGANSGHHEIGTENFELHDGTVNKFSIEDGNLNFYNQNNAIVDEGINPIVRDFKILKGISKPNGEFVLDIALDRPFNFSSGSKLKIAVQTSDFSTKKTHSYVVPCVLVSTESSASTKHVVIKVKTRLSICNVLN